MNKLIKCLLLVAAIALLGLSIGSTPARGEVAPAAAPSYEIAAFTLSSGGGQIKGGSYTLNASIGHSCAGRSSGSNADQVYELDCRVKLGPDWYHGYLPIVVR